MSERVTGLPLASCSVKSAAGWSTCRAPLADGTRRAKTKLPQQKRPNSRSEEHTSELQSLPPRRSSDLVGILQREIGRRLVHLQSAAGGWHTAREDKVTPTEKAKQREGQHAEHRAADFAAVAFRLAVRPL